MGFLLVDTMKNMRKTLSIITLISFIITSCLPQAGYARPVVPKPASTAGLFDHYLIPSDAGVISDVYLPPIGVHDPLVFIIQDLHCHAEVQKNISTIITALDKKQPLTALYVEGASGDLDTEWLKRLSGCPSYDLLSALAESGTLSAAEYFIALNKSAVPLIGVDRQDLHHENIVRLQQLEQSRSQTATQVGQLKKEIDSLAQKYLSSRNKHLFTQQERFAQKKISAERYYVNICAEAKKAGIVRQRYAALQNYVQGYTELKSINTKKAGKELQGLSI